MAFLVFVLFVLWCSFAEKFQVHMFYKKVGIESTGGADDTVQKFAQKNFHREDIGDSQKGITYFLIIDIYLYLTTYLGMTFRFSHTTAKELISTYIFIPRNFWYFSESNSLFFGNLIRLLAPESVSSSSGHCYFGAAGCGAAARPSCSGC